EPVGAGRRVLPVAGPRGRGRARRRLRHRHAAQAGPAGRPPWPARRARPGHRHARHRPRGPVDRVGRRRAAARRVRRRVDLVTMTGHAFQELRTDEEVLATLRGMRDAIRPDGRVAFETRNPGARAWESWDGRSSEIPYQGDTVTVRYEVRKVEGEFVTFAEITDGGRWHDQVDLGTLRFLPRIELDRFLAEAGL